MDQADIAAYKKLHENLKESSQDRETFKLVTLHFFNNLIAREGYGDGVYEQKSEGKELFLID